MAQVTEFPTPPNLKPNEYLMGIGRLADYLHQTRPEFRALRDRLRQWNLWDKERTRAWLGFLLVPLDSSAPIAPGVLLDRLLSVDQDSDRRRLLFRFFLDRNPLLIKTIFDALDTERDGRIQSTNELYRIITSYVYSGDYITLPEFRNWVAWMEAVHVLKLVGIRWGLGPVGELLLPRIRQMDIEEIQEDEEAGIPSEWEEELQAAARAATGAEAAPAAGSAAGEALPTEAKASADDAADAPQDGPPTGDNDALTAGEEAEAQAGDGGADLVVLPPPGEQAAGSRLHAVPDPGPRHGPGWIKPASPPPTPVKPANVAPIFLQGGRNLLEELTDAQRFANAERVRSWWSGYVYRQPYRARDFGVSPGPSTAPGETLFELAVGGLFAHRPEGGTAARAALDALRISGLLEGIRTGQTTLDAAIGSAGLLGLVAGDARFLDLLPRIAQVGLALRAEPRTLEEIFALGPDEAIEHLYVKIYGRTAALAPFWIVREALLGGWIEDATFERVACVPTRRTREQGLRLGFLERLYAESLSDLVEVAGQLSRFFGPDCEFNAPLDQLHDALGCRFRCPFAGGCDYDCREKTAL